MAKLSNEFKETVKEVMITVAINAIGAMLKSVGETLIDSKKFEQKTIEAKKEGAVIDNGKV